MARGAALSLLGMYNWNNTIFDGMLFPDGFTQEDTELFKNNLLMDCAELEILYSDWNFLRFAIINWSAKEVPTWQRIFDASLLEYNPIENYNRTETTTETHSGSILHTGTDSVQASGKDTNQASGSDIDALLETDTVTNSGSDTDTLSRTSFENNTFAAAEKTVHERATGESVSRSSNNNHTHGRKDELSYGKRDETTYGHTITDTTGKTITGNISGNIGVTTSQQMLEQEMEITPKLNVINYMIESFKNRFCLLVY